MQKSLVPGDNVEILDGALAGYEAVVTELRGRDRVALMLRIAGRHVALVAPSAAVQRVT
jgi:transcription antitermination factor NusG